MILSLCLIFLLGILTDIFWSYWHIAVSNHKRIVAANWSVCIFLSGLLYIKAISESDWISVGVYMIGAWVGTYISVGKHENE